MREETPIPWYRSCRLRLVLLMRIEITGRSYILCWTQFLVRIRHLKYEPTDHPTMNLNKRDT